MKIWIKLVIGTVAGILLGMFLPQTAKNTELFSYLMELIINVGRYIVMPMVFFSVAIGTYELKQDGTLLKTYTRIILYLALSTALLTVLGTFSVLVISPARIPIIIEEEIIYSLPTFKQVLFQIFPRNLFTIFTGDSNFLFPLFFFALFLGLNFTFDRLITKPAVQIFDSISRIFYHINSFIVEVISIGIFAISTYFVMQIQATEELVLYRQLIITLVIDSAVILFGLFPALLYFLGRRENPYRWLYAVIAPAVVGFFSRDSFFSLSYLVKHGHENLGIPRKTGSASFPIFAMFGKAGTALVTSVSFVIILRSYSSLGIGITQLLWVLCFTFLVSFILGSVPGMGAFVALSILCTHYGAGVEEGYLIMKPIAPVLISFSVFLDVVTSAFASYLTAVQGDVQKQIEVRDYV
jgi:aerobic C4-dicarboxylate transport protein